MDRARQSFSDVAMVRIDAGFPSAALLAGLEARGIDYVSRLRANPTAGPGVTRRHQILMQLLRCPPLLARLPGLGLQPNRQLRRMGIKLAWPLGNAELRLNSARPQILPNSVARQLRPRYAQKLVTLDQAAS